MDSSRNSSKAKAAKGTAAALGLFAIVYVVWFWYAVIVLYPNDANSSLIGAVGLSLMASLGVTTVAMSRSIWLRSSGRSTNARLFWIYTPFMVVFPVLVSPPFSDHADFRNFRLCVAAPEQGNGACDASTYFKIKKVDVAIPPTFFRTFSLGVDELLRFSRRYRRLRHRL